MLWAAFYGRDKTARRLLEKGSKPDIQPQNSHPRYMQCDTDPKPKPLDLIRHHFMLPQNRDTREWSGC